MVQAYPIFVRHLRDEIQERKPIRPARLVIHSTANPGATDEDHFRWLDGARRHGWANYYLDHDSISELVPEGMLAPAQGPTANSDSISIEMCEPATTLPWAEQVRQFQETWNRAVWLSADILHRYGWGVDKLYAHFEISQLYPKETNHTDPQGFFARYGRSWVQFKAEVAQLLEEMHSQYPKPADWQYEPMQWLQQEGLLHTMRHPRQPVEWWELGYMLQRIKDRAVQEAMEQLRKEGKANG